jgi:hypothetical protein
MFPSEQKGRHFPSLAWRRADEEGTETRPRGITFEGQALRGRDVDQGT